MVLPQGQALAVPLPARSSPPNIPPIPTSGLHSNVSKTFSGCPIWNFPSSSQHFNLMLAFIFLHKDYPYLIILP